MAGWMTHLLAFLVGIGVGAFLMSTRSGRSGDSLPARRQSDKMLRRLYKDCPQFFDNIRDELGRPEFRSVREFAILDSPRTTFVSEGLRVVCYEEELSNIREIAASLEEGGFIDEITSGRFPIYRMRDHFVSALATL